MKREELVIGVKNTSVLDLESLTEFLNLSCTSQKSRVGNRSGDQGSEKTIVVGCL